MQSNNPRFSKVEQAIFKTLLYSDIFDFPLSKNELWKFLISSEKITRELFENSLLKQTNFEKFDIFNSKKQIVFRDGYYFFAGRDDIVQKRINNKQEVKKKLQIAKKAAFYLSLIPNIQYISISGGLALGNVDKGDDIDFFIITKKNSLFMTRFWIIIILEMLSLRRQRRDKNPSNKICVNLLIDETSLSWGVKNRDLYVAHEIIQTRPIFERNGMGKKFLESNNWIREFFPNFNINKLVMPEKKQTDYFTLRFINFFFYYLPFESLMQRIQKYYMRKYKTTETVLKTFIAFHPKDYRPKTMENLRSKLKNFGLLTNP